MRLPFASSRSFAARFSAALSVLNCAFAADLRCGRCIMNAPEATEKLHTSVASSRCLWLPFGSCPELIRPYEWKQHSTGGGHAHNQQTQGW